MSKNKPTLGARARAMRDGARLRVRASYLIIRIYKESYL